MNKLKSSLFLTFNDSLIGHEEIIPISAAPANTLTSYKGLIFFLIIAIFSIICPKRKYFKFTNKLLPFLIFLYCFSCSPSYKSENSNLKNCSNSDFFSIETIKMTKLY